MLLLAGGSAALVAGPSYAQPAAVPTVGILFSGAASQSEGQFAALRRSLAGQGFEVGRNLRLEFRSAENRYEMLPALAAELVQQRVAVIVAAGGHVSAAVAKAATTNIPVVFTAVTDPVGTGLVANLARPGGNLTGVAILGLELDAKRLELLHELAPDVALFATLVNPNNASANSQAQAFAAAAQSVGRRAAIIRAADVAQIDAAIEAAAAQGAGALVVGADPFFNSHRQQLIALAERHRWPSAFQWRQATEQGGLVSYGPDLADVYRLAGTLVGRILRGEKPESLPVLQPTRFEMVVNLRTARALGLKVPQSFLLRADEVIE